SLRFAPENETQNNNTLLSFSSTPYIQSSVLPVPVLPAIEKYGVYKDFPVPRTTTFLSISCISFMVLSEQILLLITVLSKASICLFSSLTSLIKVGFTITPLLAMAL